VCRKHFYGITLTLLALGLGQSISYASLSGIPQQPVAQFSTETTFSYQNNGDLASQILSWADNQNHLLNNIQQTTSQQSYEDTPVGSACRTQLPAELKQKNAYLICSSHTRYLQSTTPSGPDTPITSFDYLDSRTDNLLAQVDPMGHVAVYQYDQLGRRTAIIYQPGQADQRKITIGYLNANGLNNHTGYNEVTATYTNGVEKRTLVDALGRSIHQQVNTCPDGPNTIPGCGNASDYGTVHIDSSYQGGFRDLASYSYQNSAGVIQQQVQSTKDTSGAITRYQYDSLGRRSAVITTEQPQLNQATILVTRGIIYDDVDRLQISYQRVTGTVSKGDPHVVQVKYFDIDNKVNRTQLVPLYQLQDKLGIAANQLFNSVNRAALEQYLATKPAIGLINTTEYNGLLQKQQQQNGLQQINYYYNDQGLVDKTSIKALMPNSPGANTYQRQNYYNQQTQYNLLGQVTQVTLSRSSSNGLMSTTSHIGSVRQYNSLGELIDLAAVDASGNANLLPTAFAYNKDGKLIARSDSYAGITYCNSYNNYGQRLASSDVLSRFPSACTNTDLTHLNTKLWSYYQADNSQHQPAGKLSSIDFASPNRPADTISYTYYLDGALKQLSYADGLTITYQYNLMGQMTKVSYSRQGVLQNQKSTYQYGSGTSHQLLTVTSGAMQVSYQYNDMGKSTKTIRTGPNKLTITTLKTYNGYDLLATSTVSQGDKQQQQVNYGYIQGRLNQVQVIHPQIPTGSSYNSFNYIKTYSYDGLDRLTGVMTSSIAGKILNKVGYSLDINDNIQSISGNHPVSYTYNAIDQLVGKSDSNWRPKYIAGNLTNETDGSQYKYNNLNQLIQYTSPGGELTNYQYYPNGALQSESQGQTNKLTFYYSQGKIVQITDSQGNWTSYLTGLTREGVLYHHADGSSEAVFYAYQGKTPSGWLGQADTTWQQHNSYGLSQAVYHSTHSQPPANPLSLANNPRLMGFNDNYQDPVSHDVFMGARVYDPNLQRFLQLDSMDVSNRYAYAKGNPVLNYDPSGHFSVSTFFKKLVSLGIYYAIFQVLFLITDQFELSAGLLVLRSAVVGGLAAAGRDGVEIAQGNHMSARQVGLDTLVGAVGEGLCGLKSMAFSAVTNELFPPEELVDSNEITSDKLIDFSNPKRKLMSIVSDMTEPAIYGVTSQVIQKKNNWYWTATFTLGYGLASLPKFGLNNGDNALIALSKDATSSTVGAVKGAQAAALQKDLLRKSYYNFVERFVRYDLLRIPARAAYKGIHVQG
jgi:RHS repeat-associated protein